MPRRRRHAWHRSNGCAFKSGAPLRPPLPKADGASPRTYFAPAPARIRKAVRFRPRRWEALILHITYAPLRADHHADSEKRRRRYNSVAGAAHCSRGTRRRAPFRGERALRADQHFSRFTRQILGTPRLTPGNAPPLRLYGLPLYVAQRKAAPCASGQRRLNLKRISGPLC